MWQLSYFLGFFAALALLLAAGQWWQVVNVAGDRVGNDASRLRNAASATAITFVLLGLALLAAVLDRIA